MASEITAKAPEAPSIVIFDRDYVVQGQSKAPAITEDNCELVAISFIRLMNDDMTGNGGCASKLLPPVVRLSWGQGCVFDPACHASLVMRADAQFTTDSNVLQEREQRIHGR